MVKRYRLARAVLAGLGLFWCATGKAETFIVTTNVPPTHWASTQGGEPFMKCVKEATGNGIDFSYFPSGQIATFFQSLDAVNNGLAQISYIVISAQTDRMPLNGIPMLPGLGESVVDMTASYRKALDGTGLIAQEFKRNRIHPLLINMFPQYQMISRSEPFDSLEKIGNKKISSGGGSLIFTLNGLGAKAIEMAPSDLYLALQQGTVDGVMLAIASVPPYKLQEVTKYMSANGHFGSAAGVWSIDSAVWEKLSPAKQKALTECGLKVEASIAKYADELTASLITQYRSSGVTVFNYAPDTLAILDKRLTTVREDYVARLGARGIPAPQALKEYLADMGK